MNGEFYGLNFQNKWSVGVRTRKSERIGAGFGAGERAPQAEREKLVVFSMAESGRCQGSNLCDQQKRELNC